MTKKQQIEFIRSYGFNIGPRDYERKHEFSGKFMAYDAEDTDGFCIVGDDFDLLLKETVTEIEAGL